MSDEISFRLDEKIAIVTGASRGIGEAMARAFAARGATVVLASRDQAALDAVAESINGENEKRDGKGRALAIACNTGKPGDIDALFEKVKAELGRVDVLVNNAATNPWAGPAVRMPIDAYDKTFDVNVKGCFLVCQHAARLMIAQGTGSIINIASVAGIRPGESLVVYSATKAAIINLTQGLAKELGPLGVRVNAIAPGLVETQLASALIENEKLHRMILAGTPLRRHAQPREIVGAALYLASDASSFTTGSVLVCDGGSTT